MHISRDYISDVTVSELAGPLMHPPLKNKAGHPSDQAFGKEINREGIYVHKLFKNSSDLKEKLTKIRKREIPTPATFIGAGMHRLYNHRHWENSSGLVFAPDCPSLLSYKGDIGSYRLGNCLQSFSKFDDGDINKQYEKYSGYLSDQFNKLDLTSSAFNNRKKKKLLLVENVQHAKMKYRELEVRANRAFRIKQNQSCENSDDVSSKYVIAKLLKPSNKLPEHWTKKELIAELELFCKGDAELAIQLEHAIKKIQLFNSDQQIQLYVKRGGEEPTKKNYYVETTNSFSGPTPNEHLLLPTLENVLGILANIESVDGIDQALRINEELRVSQVEAGLAKNDNPALVYQISLKKNTSITHLRWTRDLMPWSTKGLLEFAKTGCITTVDGNNFDRFNHFSLIDRLANSGSLVLFTDKKEIYSCVALKNFVDDLSTIKEDESNLLHLAIENDQDLNAIKFFFFWKVDAFNEKNQDGKTALVLAEEKKHCAFDFLQEAKKWAQDSSVLSSHRNAYIVERLSGVPDSVIKIKNSTYNLRDGSEESGQASFIPDLGTYRVTTGQFSFNSLPGIEFNGVQKYSKQFEAMIFSIGSSNKCGKLEAVGSWSYENSFGKNYPQLQLGTRQHIDKRNPIQGLPAGSTYSFVSRIRNKNSKLVLEIQEETPRFFVVKAKIGLTIDPLTEDLVTDSCTYVETVVFIPKNQINQLSEDINLGKLSIFDIDPKSFCKHLPSLEKRLIKCKHSLANIFYLKAWKATLAQISTEERQYISSKSPEFLIQIEESIKKNMEMLRLQIEDFGLNSAPELIRKDENQTCLLQEIVAELSTAESKDFAQAQYFLGRRLELLTDSTEHDMQLARALYEKASMHELSGAEYALARFYKQGLGGITENFEKSWSYIELAAMHGERDAQLQIGEKNRIDADLHAAQQRLNEDRDEAALRQQQLSIRPHKTAMQRFGTKIIKIFNPKKS